MRHPGPTFRPNHWAILSLIVLHQAFSMLWYSPYGFGLKWINLTGYSLRDIPPPTSIAFYTPFIVSIAASTLLCYGFAVLFFKLKINKLNRAIKASIFFWLIFLFSFTATHHSFANRPIMLTLIDMGRDFVLFLITAVVLFLSRKPSGI